MAREVHTAAMGSVMESMSEPRPLLPEGSPFELWDVRLACGDLKMSIDELDAAFAAGQIDGSTLVRRRGTVRWVTLGKAANLDQPDASPDASSDAAPRDIDPNEVERLSAAVSRPPIPRPTPKKTVRPPPLPASALVAPLVEPARLAPIVVDDHRADEPARTASSLPPPVTLSTTPEAVSVDGPARLPSIGDDTNAAIEALRPRRVRGRWLASVGFAAVLGAAVVTTWKVPSLRARVTTVLRQGEPAPAAPAAAVTSAPATLAPAAAEPLPAASTATATSPAATPAPAATPHPAASHPDAPAARPAAAHSTVKAPVAPAKPKAATPRSSKGALRKTI